VDDQRRTHARRNQSRLLSRGLGPARAALHHPAFRDPPVEGKHDTPARGRPLRIASFRVTPLDAGTPSAVPSFGPARHQELIHNHTFLPSND
jgi:hypothetical protein